MLHIMHYYDVSDNLIHILLLLYILVETTRNIVNTEWLQYEYNFSEISYFFLSVRNGRFTIHSTNLRISRKLLRIQNQFSWFRKYNANWYAYRRWENVIEKVARSSKFNDLVSMWTPDLKNSQWPNRWYFKFLNAIYVTAFESSMPGTFQNFQHFENSPNW